jgi:hypothetical protein
MGEQGGAPIHLSLSLAIRCTIDGSGALPEGTAHPKGEDFGMRFPISILLALASATPALAQASGGAREQCRVQARATYGTAEADRDKRRAFVRRCMQRAGAGGRDDAAEARRDDCRREMRLTFSPGKTGAGRGDAGAPREMRQAFVRGCMRRTR